MITRQIIINYSKTGNAKFFDIPLSKLPESIAFIEYNSGVLSENGMYNFNQLIAFQLIDLYLSTFATPQPLKRLIA